MVVHISGFSAAGPATHRPHLWTLHSTSTTVAFVSTRLVFVMLQCTAPAPLPLPSPPVPCPTKPTNSRTVFSPRTSQAALQCRSDGRHIQRATPCQHTHAQTHMLLPPRADHSMSLHTPSLLSPPSPVRSPYKTNMPLTIFSPRTGQAALQRRSDGRHIQWATWGKFIAATLQGGVPVVLDCIVSPAGGGPARSGRGGRGGGC
jgi:hypothetical protein